MDYRPKILAFAGSLRKGSYNKKLIKIAARGAEEAGAAITIIDLNDFQLPIYNEDDETAKGLPENALKLKKLMQESDGFIIATPEYNSSLPAVVKNTIDWASRKASPDEQELICFRDKIALILSASPGNLGGLRSLTHLRAILENIYTMVLPEQKAISQANDAFNEDGSLKNPKQEQAVKNLAKKLVAITKKLKS